MPKAFGFMEAHSSTAALLCREVGDEVFESKTIMFMTRLRRFLWFMCRNIQKALPNPWTRNFLVNCVARAHQDAMSLYIFGGKKLINEDGYIFSKQKYLEGGFLLVRRLALVEAGGFNSKYFLGDEGFELTHRLRKKGWELCYLVNVRVIHYGAKSSEGLTDEDLHRMEASWRNKQFKKQFTISIVNWNVSGYLEKCLESIYKYSQGIDLEVIVVDNASSDSSVNKENVGYGSAHNQAIEIAQGKFIVFLNPDTEMLPETLPKAFGFMEAHTDAGALMCREVSDLSERNEALEVGFTLRGRRRFLWRLSHIIERILPNPLTGNYIVETIIERRANFKHGYFFIQTVYLEGGFLMVKRQAIEEAGSFNPKFFLCEEGVDLTQRIRKLGWKLFLLLNIYYIHYGSKSSELMGEHEINRLQEEWKERV
ncbi:MAG: glycosyltransferase family 2 protein [Candidatus Omnitrophica bacterium]|nr:glycosyltransferase family 2 protein [Candidatus Omnitrophota bacterium]